MSGDEGKEVANSAEILNSAEIEGECRNRDDVRSSVAKRMEVVLSGAKSAISREAEARADMKSHGLSRKSFFDGISETRKRELLKQLKAVWTHDSTAIEGNALSLGDTMAVLEYGLTVKGKPLKDHQDVASHAKGVEFVQSLIGKTKITADHLLHCTALSSERRRAISIVPL